MTEESTNNSLELTLRHVRFGWWMLLVFLTLGIALEAAHGFKSDWYLNLDHEVRRMMLRLAHGQGTAMALLHLAFGFCVKPYFCKLPRHSWQLASPLLIGASLLLPSGFVLAGIFLHNGEAGPGIVLVPLGGLLLVLSLLLAVLSARPYVKHPVEVN
ncbi:MAG: hypothetical protein ACSHX8_04505 [Opitutaceae bacterium]